MPVDDRGARRKRWQDMAQSPGPHTQQDQHRSMPHQQLQLESGGGPGPGRARNPHMRPGRFHLPNRKALLVVGGVTMAAGGGGLVYDQKRRRAANSAGVSKTSGWQKAMYDERFTGKENKHVRAAYRDNVRNEQHGGRKILEGAGIGGSIGAGIGAVAGRGRGALVGGLFGAETGASTGFHLAAARARRAIQDKMDTGELEYHDHSKKEKRVKKSYPVAVPVPTSRSVTPIVPRGGHVSRENDLSVTTHRNKRRGSPSALAMYRSGSQSQMTGGGHRYGHAAGHVGKSLDTQQGAARFASRGTPMADLGKVSRIGRRLDVV